MSLLWKKIKNLFFSQMKLQNVGYIKKMGLQYKRNNSQLAYVTHPNNSNDHGSNLIFNTRYISWRVLSD